jgi:hypothetical protein
MIDLVSNGCKLLKFHKRLFADWLETNGIAETKSETASLKAKLTEPDCVAVPLFL